MKLSELWRSYDNIMKAKLKSKTLITSFQQDMNAYHSSGESKCPEINN